MENKDFYSIKIGLASPEMIRVTTKKVRRERMGHIELACPVSHIWYFKAVPSRMALVLDMSPKALEQVLYFAENVVLDPGTTPLERGMVLNEKTLRENQELYGEDAFRVGMVAATSMLCSSSLIDSAPMPTRKASSP